MDTPRITMQQSLYLWKLAKLNGFDKYQLIEIIKKETGHKYIGDISMAEADNLIKEFKKNCHVIK